MNGIAKNRLQPSTLELRLRRSRNNSSLTKPKVKRGHDGREHESSAPSEKKTSSQTSYRTLRLRYGHCYEPVQDTLFNVGSDPPKRRHGHRQSNSERRTTSNGG